MDADELRDAIWEYLYQSRRPRTIDEIATSVDGDVPAIRAAVNHEWFKVTQDGVSIAYT
jgi:hypothetical protein